MKRYLIYILLYVPSLLFSQTHTSTLRDTITRVDPEIKMEDGIDRLLNNSLEINKTKGGIEGFCVQIYNGQSREEAQRYKYRFMKLFPEIKSITYERVSPNWITKVGKFRTKRESEKLQHLISKKFPNCFVSKIIVKIGEFD